MKVPLHGVRPEHAARQLSEARVGEAANVAPLGIALEGGIHRINNPLASLLACLEQLCGRLPEVLPANEQQLELVRLAQEARVEGARVVAAVRELAGLLPAGVPSPVVLNDLVAGLVSELVRRFGDELEIETRLGTVRIIAAREKRLAHALLSAADMCVEALRARQIPVRLAIRTGERGAERAWVRFDALCLERSAGALRELFVDEGVAMLHGVVQQLGGSVVFTDAALELSFPTEVVFYDSEAEVSLKRRESAPPRGELRILVVDDEPSIQRALERGLRELGVVQSVTSGRGAIELLEGGATFDVVLSDVVMSDGTGIDVADWLARHSPRLKRRLVLMTGMGDTRTDSHPDVMTVGKPFDLPALRELVCQVATRT